MKEEILKALVEKWRAEAHNEKPVSSTEHANIEDARCRAKNQCADDLESLIEILGD